MMQATPFSPAGDHGPPSPPPFRGRIVLTRKQLFGLPLLFAVPLFALAGLLGESTGHVGTSSRCLEMQIDFPSRIHYRQSQALRVSVRNRTRQLLDTVTVSFNAEYVSAFSQVSFAPAAARAYQVTLPAIAPDDTRLVVVEVSGEHYGHHAAVVAAIAGDDTVRAQFNTLVFP